MVSLPLHAVKGGGRAVGSTHPTMLSMKEDSDAL